MASELLAGIGLFKSMLDTAKGLKDMNDTAVRNAAAIDLQEKILTVQAEQVALVERIGQLEKEVTRFETWEAEKERYKLTELPPGVFVYALQENAEGGEPMHYLCETCFNKGHKSVLQNRGNFNGLDHFECHACDAKINAGYGVKPEVISDYDPLA